MDYYQLIEHVRKYPETKYQVLNGTYLAGLLKIGPKWYLIWDYGKIEIKMANFLISKTYWR
jgi:hypothetical protein